jgi:hypothetical protein
MLFKKLQQGFNNKNIMKLISNWLIFFGIVVAFYVIKIYYCPKIVDMHVWF